MKNKSEDDDQKTKTMIKMPSFFNLKQQSLLALIRKGVMHGDKLVGPSDDINTDGISSDGC